MRITNQSLSQSVIRQIQQLGSRQAELQTQVATGLRITQPEDDPSAVARVLDLTSEHHRIGQYLRNADRALGVSQASYAGLQQIKRLSDRAGELAMLGAGTISASEAQAYAAEADQLLEQGMQVANTRFGGDLLFAGTAVGIPAAFTRDAGGIEYQGNDQRATIPLSETSGIAPGSGYATNVALKDFLGQLSALATALKDNAPETVSALRSDLLTSEDHIVSALAEHGAVQTRIEANRTEQTDRATSLEGLISSESDADLPSTIVKLNQAQTAYEAALQSGAKIMRLSLLDYVN